jgi:DNA uptake protein ComE-like DNA-binding protein
MHLRLRPLSHVPVPGKVDLNTGSIEELNTLTAGGRIGRAIISGRPYTSPEQLIQKRVLSRAKFEQIKDQITVN